MNEPTAIVGAITSALTATISILLFLDVDSELVGALTAAVTAWVGVAAAFLRARVTPTSKVALTTDDVALIDAAQKGI